MYRNLGNKLKVIAKVFRWVLFGALEALGAITLFTSYPEMGRALAATAIMALAPLLAWISSLGFYALGHVVENSDIRTDLPGHPAVRRHARRCAQGRRPRPGSPGAGGPGTGGPRPGRSHPGYSRPGGPPVQHPATAGRSDAARHVPPHRLLGTILIRNT